MGIFYLKLNHRGHGDRQKIKYLQSTLETSIPNHLDRLWAKQGFL